MRGLRRAAGTAAPTAAAVPVLTRRTTRPLLVPRASDSDEAPEEITRDTIKRLTKLYYYDKAEPLTTSTSQANNSQPDSRQTAAAAAAASCPSSGLHFSNLPLWRTEWAVLPGCQEFLHVLAPHYVHMFEAIFSRPRPWLFGHLLLPAGSRSLGSAGYALASGSSSPLVGVLVQVTRAVRLRDGKFLILSTACARFKVVRCVRELPYSVADVELLEDAELADDLQGAAMTAVLQAAGDEVSITSVMAAASAATREAAAAVAWAWLRGYELAVAAKQEWPGPGPREGDSDLETHLLVQELMAHGVSEVLPLPDGVVIGRCDLRQVAAAADTALQETLRNIGHLLQAGQAALEGGSSGLLGSSSSITSLNTVTQRGVYLQGTEFEHLLSSSAASATLEDLLMLEAAVWAQLDTLIVLANRVRGTRVVGQLEQDKAELRQALLECTSVAQRLRFVLAVLGKHIKVLAAVAAVKSVQGEQRPDGGAGTQS
ncbi:hypothetical protein OEZ86_001925 [Tetradesmus obliquus]|nr:hypothetical protein OEZ86_001925 [Tetradesmus obliquus]